MRRLTIAALCLLVAILFIVTVVRLAEQRAKIEPPPPAPVDPAPAKIKLYFFTQDGCAPCALLRQMLDDPLAAAIVRRLDLQVVAWPDALFEKYNITATPTLILAVEQPIRLTGCPPSIEKLLQWLEGSIKDSVLYSKDSSDPRTAIIPGGKDGPGNVHVTTDLPLELRLHNTGGRDGVGLCVFTAITHSSHYQNERRLWNLLQQMTHEPGGGYPEKVTAMIAKYGPGTRYVQYVGNDPAILELALKTGRMPAVTYNGHDSASPRRPDAHGHYPTFIAHMVNLVFLDGQHAAILDNNFEKEILWMTRDEFLQRWTGHAKGWAVILLAPRPPPLPRAA